MSRPAILDQVATLGWAVFERGSLNLNLVVERYPWVEDHFESRLHCIYRNELGGWVHHSWPCTTWPGVPGLRRPVNPKGTAILAPLQFRGAWILGHHRGRRALVQEGAPVAVYRDGDRDGVPEIGGELDWGYHGIQVHVAGAGTDGGLGCIMTATNADQLDLLEYVDRSVAVYGPRLTISVLEAA